MATLQSQLGIGVSTLVGATMGMGIPAVVTLDQDADNTIALSQAATSNIKTLSATNTIAVTQVAAGEGVFSLQSKLGASGSTLVGSTMAAGIPATGGQGILATGNTITLSQSASPGLFTLAASNAIVLVQTVRSGNLSRLATNTIVLTDVAVSLASIISLDAENTIPIVTATDSNRLSVEASNAIVLAHLNDAAGPRNADASSPITLTDEATVTFNVFGRVASNDMDIDGAQPAEGGRAESSIKDLQAVTPDPQTDDPNDLPTFTQNWGNAARLTDTFDLTVSNTIVVSQDLPQPTGDRSKFAVNTLNILDFADNNQKSRSVTNALSLLQVATTFKVHRAVNTLAMTVTVQEGFVNLFAENIIDLQQLGRGNPFPKDSVTDIDIDGTWGNVATSNIRNLDASSPITIAQDINVQRPYVLDAENEISGITDDIFVPPIGPIIPGVPFGMSDEVTVQINPIRNPENLIIISDLAQVVHLRVDAVDLSADTFTGLTQVANLSETGDAETIIDSFQVIAGVVLNTEIASNTLTTLFDQAVVSVLRDALAVDNIIELKHAVGFSLVSNTTDCDYTPFVGESDADTVPPRPELPEVRIPVLPGVRFRLVSPPFDTGATIDTLDLRAPVFGNRERLEPTRIQRETQGGTLSVFADPIWPKVHSLEMQFTALKTAQARGLLNFVERHLGEEIGIYDYEGRIWRGVITNPDEAVVNDGRENYSATLQIEAERVYQLNRVAQDNLGMTDTTVQNEDFALNAIAVTQAADFVFKPVEPSVSPIALATVSDYTRVPVAEGANAISLTAFATRNSFFFESATSPISLGQSGRDVNFGDFGNLIHNWDARDIPDADGTSISTWADSVGSVDLVNSGSFRPTVRDGILNGERVVEFRHSVSVQRLISNGTLPVFDSTNKTGTIFIVLTVREAMSGDNNLVFGTNPGSPDSTVIYLGGSTSAERPVAYKSPEGVVALETPTSVLGDDTSHVLVWSRNNNDVSFRRNKVTQAGHTLATNPVPLTDDLYVGGLGSGNSADMDIAQILVYDDILDLADIKTIEGIITAIWGV